MPALQAAPVNAGEVIAKARPRVEEGGIEQQAAQQQQDRLLGPAHDQLVHHIAGLMIAAQGVFEPQQVILVGADELDDPVVAVAGTVDHLAAIGRRHCIPHQLYLLGRLLGGGQLGRLFVLAARAMGYRVTVLDPAVDSPAAQMADRHLAADYDDEQALEQLARECAAVTTEFENVPAASLEYLAARVPVRPGAVRYLTSTAPAVYSRAAVFCW